MKNKIALLIILFAGIPSLTAGVPAITSPAAGEIWSAGSTHIITWSPSNPPVSEVGKAIPTVFIDLNLTSSCSINSLSSCSGSTNVPYIITESAPDTGSYIWSVPSTISFSYEGPVTLTVGLSDSSAQGSSQFYITGANSYISPTPLTSPIGGEVWGIGSSQIISWTAASSTATEVNINLVPINLTSCSGASISCGSTSSSIYTLASNIANNGSYSWNINNSINGQIIPPGQYLVSLSDAANGTVFASSAVAITLTAQMPTTTLASSTAPQISGINPNSGNIGQLINIIGSGFTPTNNTVEFGGNTYITGLNSGNGQSVQFTVPIHTQPCAPANVGPCTLGTSALITPGAYGISVSNQNGTSNTLPFEVTSNPGSQPPSTTPPVSQKFPDGSLLIVSGSPTVYLVSNGIFIPFTNSQIFLAYGYQWQQIQTISRSDLNSQNIRAVPEPAPNGSIIKSQDNPTIYLIVNGQKSAIPSLAVFYRLGLNLKNLIVLSNQEIAGYSSIDDQNI